MIFISYSSKDILVARRYAEKLTNQGYCVWFNEASIDPGKNISGELSDVIKMAEKFILIASENSNKSDWVKREIEEFIKFKDREKILVPIVYSNRPAEEILADFGKGLERNLYLLHSKGVSENCRSILQSYFSEENTYSPLWIGDDTDILGVMHSAMIKGTKFNKIHLICSDGEILTNKLASLRKNIDEMSGKNFIDKKKYRDSYLPSILKKLDLIEFYHEFLVKLISCYSEERDMNDYMINRYIQNLYHLVREDSFISYHMLRVQLGLNNELTEECYSEEEVRHFMKTDMKSDLCVQIYFGNKLLQGVDGAPKNFNMLDLEIGMNNLAKYFLTPDSLAKIASNQLFYSIRSDGRDFINSPEFSLIPNFNEMKIGIN